ncbi:TPA: hypothetical protein EYP66_19725 [Candidatus Poribacteria bacterium]|nr:hypothetical protein [Candidatus Poribacteria bacterium]
MSNFRPEGDFSSGVRKRSNEEILLINCAKTQAAKDLIEKFLNPDLDWEYIIQSALSHRIAPLLYYNLKLALERSEGKVSAGLVPQRIIEKLRETYIGTLVHNLLASHELSEILKSLLDAQIKVILLKGIGLAKTVYPNIAVRPFSDIDLLISKEDLHKIEAKLSQFGYDLLYDYRPGFAFQFENKKFYVNRNGVSIDLHWHVANLPYSKYLAIATFWESAIPVDIEGVDTLVLSPENLLIHLSLHVSEHYYSQLLWLVDISEVIHHYSETFDWELLLEKIKRYRIHSLMRYVLRLVKELFDPPIPSFVLEQLSSYKASSFEARLFDALANPNITDIKWAIAEFLTLDGMMPKMRYMFGKLFPSRGFMLNGYPNKNIYSSYYLRVSNVLWESMKTLLQICT